MAADGGVRASSRRAANHAATASASSSSVSAKTESTPYPLAVGDGPSCGTSIRDAAASGAAIVFAASSTAVPLRSSC